MATIMHPLECRTADGFVSGLTPVCRAYKISDGAEITPAPVVASEINTTGRYKFVITLTEPLLITVDFGATLTNKDDRERSIYATPNDEAVTVVETPRGTYDINLTSIDSNGDPDGAVMVEIVNGSGQTVRTITTTANGTVAPSAGLRLDAGDYVAKSFKPRCNIPDVAFSVVDQAVSVQVVCTEVADPIPADNEQIAYLDLANNDPDAVIIADPLPDTGQDISNAILTGRRVSGAQEDGRLEISLIKTGVYRVVGRTANKVFFDEIITVSNDDYKSLLSYGA